MSVLPKVFLDAEKSTIKCWLSYIILYITMNKTIKQIKYEYHIYIYIYICIIYIYTHMICEYK